MMKPELSVIIPCFNHGIYICEALKTIDSSKYRSLVEIIIINDGSTDSETNNIISNLDHEKYIIINQENQGLARSRNNGVLLSKSDYILILDADNYVEPAFIEDFFNIKNNKIEFDALYGNARCFGNNNNLIVPGEIDIFRLIKRNYIDACAIFKKQTICNIGLYDYQMPCPGLEDWDLWLRLAFSNSKIIYRNKIYFNYRVLSNSMIRSQSEINLNKTVEYIRNKNDIHLNVIETTIENYVTKSISLNNILLLLLKKLRVLPKYKYHIKKTQF